MAYLFEKFAAENELSVYNKPTSGKRTVNKILLGTFAGVIAEQGYYYQVETAGPDGWVKKSKVTDHKHLKVFYIDVGQGDATLIEVGDQKILIDGGPNDNLHNYLAGWQYSYALDDDQQVHIDHVFVSHFDADHYFGLTPIISDDRFTFGTIYHNGIVRFKTRRGQRPNVYNTDLGRTVEIENTDYLSTSFNDLTELINLRDNGGLQTGFKRFVNALEEAQNQGRIRNNIRRLTNEDGTLVNKVINGITFKIEILGPVRTQKNGDWYFEWFKDSSHTRNGHSIVMRVEYGDVSLLFGGDLNSYAEDHLLNHYEGDNPFRVEVAKSCHHGSSDFTIDFLRKVRPFATVISSGDNESYAHPRADTLGSAGKYSRGSRPKVYSTELARSINKAGDVLYGMINLRCDGKRIYMAQMKERRSGSDVWDSYKIK
jgi:beta-lactamase superfamily II metal-dependent hydrolase